MDTRTEKRTIRRQTAGGLDQVGQSAAVTDASVGLLSGFVAAEFLLELLDPEEQLIDIALPTHQSRVH